MPKEIKVVIDRVIGSATVFRQGPTMRFIFPKRTEKFLGLDQEGSEGDNPSVVIIKTNKGILLRELKDFVNDEDMRMSLSNSSFF